MKIAISVSVLACGAAFAAMPVEPGAPLFENDQVKVVRALEKAHVKAGFHEHKVNRVMIYLQPGRQQFSYQDGRKQAVFDWKAGQVVWSVPEGMHSGEVLTDEPFNIIEVELKKPGPARPVSSSLDPIKVDPKHYKVEFENDQVRVLRVRIGAHEKTPMHEHARNRVTVYLTGQNFQVTTPDGKTGPMHRAVGEAAWNTPSSHQEENLSDRAFEAIVVEVKY